MMFFSYRLYWSLISSTACESLLLPTRMSLWTGTQQVVSVCSSRSPPQLQSNICILLFGCKQKDIRYPTIFWISVIYFYVVRIHINMYTLQYMYTHQHYLFMLFIIYIHCYMYNFIYFLYILCRSFTCQERYPHRLRGFTALDSNAVVTWSTTGTWRIIPGIVNHRKNGGGAPWDGNLKNTLHTHLISRGYSLGFIG